MAAATDQQMQAFADQHVRPRAEAIRALVAGMESDNAGMGDMYARFNQASPGYAPWADARTDGPPHLLTEESIAKYNTFMVAILAAIKNHSEYANVMAMCVRAP
jgi:hypothetical protein